MPDTDRLNLLEKTTHLMRHVIIAMQTDDDERAAELLIELEKIDPLAIPLSIPSETTGDFITNYRREQLDREDQSS